ncbi:hypothetical protein SAMN05216196_103136 [Lutimaribacter pacificus]|uniref:YARHG domain-containing protein n=1 Tax=Lutimaribacter pacificus TaxID=391948 RepID=A0A1H0G8E6_9RHOB|nr:hypothetical protein [Lutimaribacter pacificus]SDO03167.1 hypothetical protein SAMN05216196_103136 [Lutimaribacter pacificus]SHJ86000.1 hypothetical protein SAMN05444142_102137 [Lutimaribacter pacificus]
MIKRALIMTSFVVMSAVPVAAQTETDPDAPVGAEDDCAAILARPEFAELTGVELTRLGSTGQGEVLLGKTCPKDVIETYFLDRGWVLSAEGVTNAQYARPEAAPGTDWRNYCLQRFFLLRWLGVKPCRAIANIYSRNDVITLITASNII